MNFELKFPVFTVTKEGYAYRIENMQRLETCTLKAYNSLYFNNIKIYDSEFNKYQVIKAIKTKTLWTFPEVIFLNPFINIKLELSDNIEKYKLDELKAILLENIEEKNSYWRNIGMYYKVKKEIEKSLTFTDLYSFYK